MVSRHFTAASAILIATGISLLATRQGLGNDLKTELNQVMSAYREQRATGLISLNESHIDEMRTFQAELVKAGQIEAAKRINDKIERLKQEVEDLRK